MEQEKKWPQVGDKLIHKYRKKSGQVEAEVISANKANGAITLRIGNQTFPSLSSAAQAISGYAANGWLYWGLKKQHSKKHNI